MTTIKKLIDRESKKRAKRIKRRNKKLAKADLAFNGWIIHRKELHGERTMRLINLKGE